MAGIIMAPVGCAIAIIAPPPAGACVAIAIILDRLSVGDPAPAASQDSAARNFRSPRRAILPLPESSSDTFLVISGPSTALQSRLDYWLRLLPTDICRSAAQAVDRRRAALDPGVLRGVRGPAGL
jgi:hypothetical protein